MRFVSYGEKWYQLKTLSRPDQEELNYLHQSGEWSIYAEESFDKHIKELTKWNGYFSKLNGRRIKEIIRCEPLRYGRAELAELMDR
jgi:hypothetical protein